MLRVSKEGELEGLDVHEHGISAYPEYVISAHAMPSSMVLGQPEVKMSSTASPRMTGLGEAAR